MNYKNKGWACWWSFKVSGLKPGESQGLQGSNFAVPKRASVSTDAKPWKHSAPGKRSGKLQVYEIEVPAETTWFAWGPTFVLADAKRLVENTAKAKVGARPTCAKAGKAERCPHCAGSPRETTSSPPSGFRPASTLGKQAQVGSAEASSGWLG